jgi:hypothetical protein
MILRSLSCTEVEIVRTAAAIHGYRFRAIVKSSTLAGYDTEISTNTVDEKI